jgi:hypothetical protein
MRTPTPAAHWEHDRRALLRRTWQPPFDSLEVDYSREDLQLKLTTGDFPLIAGNWQFASSVNGQPLAPAGAWEEVCWHSDQDIDYLEVEKPLSGGWTLQRQIALARNDQFLFLADALLGNEDADPAGRQEIRHSFHLPLSSGVSWKPAGETREGALVAQRKTLARAMPLSLPEWRVEPCGGDLTCEAGELVFRHAGLGRNLYSPLWFDLAPARHRLECTWRRLTVGETLQVQPRDVAAGFRVQCGKEPSTGKSPHHWLIYRTLATRASRTVLGQNYAADFVLSRFFKSGETQVLVEIE